MQAVFHPKVVSRWRIEKWILTILGFSFLVSLSPSSEAGMVYGRVYGAEGVFRPGDRLDLKDAQGRKVQEVTTDTDRAYSIVIPEGTYQVEFTEGGRTWGAWIESFPRAMRQDINLTPR